MHTFLITQRIDNTWAHEGYPILRQIYAWHCIVLYPPNNRLTIQYNRERSNTIECDTIPCINLSEYWTILGHAQIWNISSSVQLDCPKSTRTFPNIFLRLPKIAEDNGRFPNTFESDPKMFQSLFVTKSRSYMRLVAKFW